ncbi:PilZ domain-containing protein [bacterium]|nr:PilZ domain-containing protein [candidate division CSSED10-310 bacterium]
MMNRDLERRQAPRRRVALPVDIWFMSGDREETGGAGVTVDLSRVGARIQCARYFTVNTRLRLHIHGSKKTVKAQARVVRVVSLRSGAFQLGVAFEKTDS